MARRDELLGVSGAETVIGAGVRLKGTIVSEGDVSIDAKLVGEIKAEGNVNIGVNAVVKANVTGINVTVLGHLTGNIKAEGEVAIGETGHVTGDIVCSSLAIATGAIFIGRSQMEVHTPKEIEAPVELGTENEDE